MTHGVKEDFTGIVGEGSSQRWVQEFEPAIRWLCFI